MTTGGRQVCYGGGEKETLTPRDRRGNNRG